MEDREYNASQKAPPNRAQALFRVVLWILPAGVSLLSAWSLGWMNFHRARPWLILTNPATSWFLLNAGFVFGAAVFNALLSRSAKFDRSAFCWVVFQFCALQILLIPLLSALMIFALTVLDLHTF